MYHNLYGENPTAYRGVCFHPSIVGWAAIWKYLREFAPTIAEKPDLSRGDIGNILIGKDSLNIIREHIREFNENPLMFELWRQSFLSDIVVEVDGKIVDPGFSWDWFTAFEQFINACSAIRFNPSEPVT